MSPLSETELNEWGERVGRALDPPAFVALRGDLGAGKSVLARAIARGAGVRAPMPSPTFNLLLRYPLDERRAVVHVDLYRIEATDDVWELGWEELPGPADLVLVEWPERAEAVLPVDRIEIALEEAGPGLRTVRVGRTGDAPELPLPAGEEARRG